MPVSFGGNGKYTVGVEIEVQLVDKDSKDLKAGALAVIEEGKKVKDLHIKSEFTQSMVEINTAVFDGVGEIGESLNSQFAKLRTIANRQGIEIAISGTHPFQDPAQRCIYPTERYRRILEKYQSLTRRFTIFGLHVHVGVASGDRAIAIINRMVEYLPHLLALSASSPFSEGKDTGLASSRASVFESLPGGGLPLMMSSWKEFQAYFDALLRRGTYTSIRDIYWDVRPHSDFGTVEIRVCDGLSTLQETLALTALIHCLVVWIDSEYGSKSETEKKIARRFWMAPENKWQASRYGLDGKITVEADNKRRVLRDEIVLLLDRLAPVAAQLRCEKELKFVEEILKTGNSANRQRHIFAQTKSLVAVVESLIQELKRR